MGMEKLNDMEFKVTVTEEKSTHYNSALLASEISSLESRLSELKALKLEAEKLGLKFE